MRPLACKRLRVLTGSAEHFLGHGFDLVFVQLVLLDQA